MIKVPEVCIKETLAKGTTISKEHQKKNPILNSIKVFLRKDNPSIRSSSPVCYNHNCQYIKEASI